MSLLSIQLFALNLPAQLEDSNTTVYIVTQYVWYSVHFGQPQLFMTVCQSSKVAAISCVVFTMSQFPCTYQFQQIFLSSMTTHVVRYIGKELCVSNECADGFGPSFTSFELRRVDCTDA